SDEEAWVELLQSLENRPTHDRALEERLRWSAERLHDLFTAPSMRCSTTGPSASAGRNVRAPIRNTVPTRSATKSGVCVGSVPALGGTDFLRASDPAIARTGTITQ